MMNIRCDDTTDARTSPPGMALCRLDDLVPFSGVCALAGQKQLALFWLPGHKPEFVAIDNFDPVGRANVLSRGIVGSINDEPVVASPLYKQHFSLVDGRCLEQADCRVQVYPLTRVDDVLYCESTC